MDYMIYGLLAWFTTLVVWNMWEFFSGAEV